LLSELLDRRQLYPRPSSPTYFGHQNVTTPVIGHAQRHQGGRRAATKPHIMGHLEVEQELIIALVNIVATAEST
jgi:hypothetical protein